MEQIQKRFSGPRRSRAQMLELRQQFERSQMTVREFSTHHHINTGILYKWKSRYQNGVHKSSAFAKVEVMPAATSSKGLFAEVKGIKIYQPVSATFLKELL